MIARLRLFAADETGSAILEYALVLSLVSMVSFAALYALGDTLQTFFANNAASLGNVGQRAQ